MEVRNVKRESEQGRQVAERLNHVIKEVLETSYSNIEKNTGLNNIRKMALGQATITPGTLRVLNMKTPINTKWLLTGEGEPLKEEVETDQMGSWTPAATKPRIINYANAGLPGETLEQNIDDYYPVIKQFPDYDATIIIHGDSMEPTYHSGDEVAVKDVTESGFRQWGMPYILNTRQGILVKRIFPVEEQKSYKCVSDNTKYPPFEIPEEEVFRVYKIVGLIRWEG